MATKAALPAWCRIVREPTAEYEAALTSRPFLATPKDVVDLYGPRLGREEVEVFMVILLDGQRRVMAMAEVTRGIVNATLVHPREVFRLAITMGASSVILMHNHPSGDPSASGDDCVITKQMVSAGLVLDMPVHDHVIVAGAKYLSFAEAGLL